MIQTTLDNFLNFGLEDKTIRGFIQTTLLQAKLINRALVNEDKDKFHTPYRHLNKLFIAIRDDILSDSDKDELGKTYIKTDHNYLLVVYPNKKENTCYVYITYCLT